MPRIEPVPGEGVLLTRVLGRAPFVRDAVLRLDTAIRVDGVVDRTLKEHVRRAVAPRLGCVYCASLGAPVDPVPGTCEAAAIRLALQMVDDPAGVDDELFADLREHLDDGALVELVAWIAYVVIGGQTFGATMRLEAASAQEAEWYQDVVIRDRTEPGPQTQRS